MILLHSSTSPQYQRALEWVQRELPARLSEDVEVNFFEVRAAPIVGSPSAQSVCVHQVTIRGLGGLMGAYTLTGDQTLLGLAEQLGRALLPAFGSPSGVPHCSVNLRTGAASCPDSDLGRPSLLSVALVVLYNTDID